MANEYITDDWYGLYRDKWTPGTLCQEAWAHPAKYAPALIGKIYTHLLREGMLQRGDCVLDPFAGVALGALPAAQNGLRFIGCELEPRFADIAGGCQCTGVTYADRDMYKGRYDDVCYADNRHWCPSCLELLKAERDNPRTLFDDDEEFFVSPHEYVGNTGLWKQRFGLGGMKVIRGDSRRLVEIIGGQCAGITSSPPYADSLESVSGIDKNLIKRPGGQNSQANNPDTRYGNSEGQLGALKEGDFGIVSSPPYNPPFSQDHNGTRGGQRGTTPSEDGAFVKYGNDNAQLEGLSMEGFGDAIISSPPYEGTRIDGNGDEGSSDLRMPDGSYARGKEGWELRKAAGARYGESTENLGHEIGETFWSAARTIVEQCYLLLKPNAPAVFVLKDYVREKKIIPFCDQWRQLCEVVGFETIHWHRAWQIENNGYQLTIDGIEEPRVVQRKGFFRRINEARYPETAIDYETVLCMIKR